MRNQLMTKKKLDGSTFMEMFSGTRSTNPCLLPLLDRAPSCLHCKGLIETSCWSLVSQIL